MAGLPKAAQATLLEQLKQPFDPRFIKWRIGQVNRDGTKATAFAYLDAREVYKRLDDVCGVGGWQDKIIEIREGFIAEISILVGDTWITRSDAADYTDMEAIKGGASSAVKRAAAVWGVGRYLYYLPTVWAPVKVLYKKKNGDPVYGLADTPTLPEWAIPNAKIERWEDVAEQELADQPDDVVFDGKTLTDYEVEVGQLNNSKAIIDYLNGMSIEEKRVVAPIVDRRIIELNEQIEANAAKKAEDARS
jgi:hypothetical protein